MKLAIPMVSGPYSTHSFSAIFKAQGVPDALFCACHLKQEQGILATEDPVTSWRGPDQTGG